MKSILSRTSIFVATLISCLSFSTVASAIVYTAGNEASGNEIIAFDVNNRGRVTEIGRFDTQGTGSGAALGNQGALALDAGDRYMFAVNSGDGTITSLRLQESGLEFVNRIDSGGFRPLSVTVFGTAVYVLNEGSQDENDIDAIRFDNISGFRFVNGGALQAIPNSTRIIDNTQPTAPAQIGFNPSGSVLLITEKATNTITTYVVQADGTPAATPLKRPSAIPTPFGFSFGDRDFVFIAEANQGGQGETVSYRVNRETGLVSSAVGRLEHGNATCWTILSSDQTVGYSTNTADGTVSIFKANFDGTMDFFFNGNSDTPIQAGAGVRDAILLQNNQFLFTLNNGDGEVESFWVNRSGAISPRRSGTAAIPGSATGLIAR